MIGAAVHPVHLTTDRTQVYRMYTRDANGLGQRAQFEPSLIGLGCQSRELLGSRNPKRAGLTLWARARFAFHFKFSL